jgi:hypothetical protein
MSFKINKIGSFLAASALGTLSMLGDANAVQLNTHGAAFHAYNASEATLVDYFVHGARNIASYDLSVIAPIVRTPVASGTSQSFWIDGDNSNGATTYFTLYAYDYLGNQQSAVSFNSNSASYDLLQTAPTISVYSYVSLFATLPANGSGVIRGVVANDP